MSADEQLPTEVASNSEVERSEKILKAKDLYSQGSRNYLVKNYADAADSLSRVCELYEEIHGELSDELGMPYLLYAKSLIALAVEENKVIDVPDEEAEDDVVDDDDTSDEVKPKTNGEAKAVSSDASEASEALEAASSTTMTNANGEVGQSKENVGKVEKEEKGEKPEEAEKVAKSADEADSTEDANGKVDSEKAEGATTAEDEDEEVTSTADGVADEQKDQVNGSKATEAIEDGNADADANDGGLVEDGEKPSTSNGAANDIDVPEEEEDEDNEAGSSLQLAWEILELAAKIFKRQGLSGLPNLAEVHTELGNIEFENNVLTAAREDYEKALKIYGELSEKYRRASAEIHYKIGLTYLMDGLNKEGAASLKEACHLLDLEIEHLKANEEAELTEQVKNTIQDIVETKQEIWDKIAEIEEMQAQQYAEVRAALDSYIKPIAPSDKAFGAGPSTSSAAAASSSSSSAAAAAASSSSSSSISSTKPNDITHLIKRKKPEEPSSEAEAAAASPAKRPAI